MSLLALSSSPRFSVHPWSAIRGPLDPRLVEHTCPSWLQVNCAVTFKSHNTCRSAAVRVSTISLLDYRLSVELQRSPGTIRYDNDQYKPGIPISWKGTT